MLMTKTTAVLLLCVLSGIGTLSLSAQDAAKKEPVTPKINPETIEEFEQARADLFEVQKRLLEIPGVRELQQQAEQENQRVMAAYSKASAECGDKYTAQWPAHAKPLACQAKPEAPKVTQQDTKDTTKKQ